MRSVDSNDDPRGVGRSSEPQNESKGLCWQVNAARVITKFGQTSSTDKDDNRLAISSSASTRPELPIRSILSRSLPKWRKAMDPSATSKSNQQFKLGTYYYSHHSYSFIIFTISAPNLINSFDPPIRQKPSPGITIHHIIPSSFH